jgi:hypothetical protein
MTRCGDPEIMSGAASTDEHVVIEAHHVCDAGITALLQAGRFVGAGITTCPG